MGESKNDALTLKEVKDESQGEGWRDAVTAQDNQGPPVALLEESSAQATLQSLQKEPPTCHTFLDIQNCEGFETCSLRESATAALGNTHHGFKHIFPSQKTAQVLAPC